jgi:hypothetical protein
MATWHRGLVSSAGGQSDVSNRKYLDQHVALKRGKVAEPRYPSNGNRGHVARAERAPDVPLIARPRRRVRPDQPVQRRSSMPAGTTVITATQLQQPVAVDDKRSADRTDLGPIAVPAEPLDTSAATEQQPTG